MTWNHFQKYRNVLIISRERVVSLEAQRRTNEANTTALWQTLTRVNVRSIQFAQEKKKNTCFLFFRALQNDVKIIQFRVLLYKWVESTKAKVRDPNKYVNHTRNNTLGATQKTRPLRHQGSYGSINELTSSNTIFY